SAARLIAINAASEYHVQPRLFININPLAVFDPESSMRSTIKAISSAGLRADQVIFEFVEGWQEDDVDHLLSILSFYHRLGFQVALDDLEVDYHSIDMLTKLRPDFVKLSMDLVHRVNVDSAKAHVAERL